jgi:hypothetical protein
MDTFTIEGATAAVSRIVKNLLPSRMDSLTGAFLRLLYLEGEGITILRNVGTVG